MAFLKLNPGDAGYLIDFPQQCICGAQKGPMVATGIPYKIPNAAPGAAGHIYLCRLCVTQSARALGMVKGDEYTRLQNAADELTAAQKEIDERQTMIEKYVEKMGADEQKIQSQKAYIETLQSEISTFKAHANQIIAQAREMAAA